MHSWKWAYLFQHHEGASRATFTTLGQHEFATKEGIAHPYWYNSRHFKYELH